MSTVNWRPSSEQLNFIRLYSKAVEAGNAAIFAGAGLSRTAGFVDWKGLLKEIAEDLGLSIDKESDLVALAQYHLNTKQNRARLNQALIEEFTKSAAQTRSHYLLARLPIHTIWTTNYDQLIERELEAAGKSVDIKLTQENLAQTRPGRDAILYKMHGCVTQPQDAVLTKDDYENYEKRRPLFVENLKGDLISKTFLFLGFSFSDPNVDYVLSRIRVLLDKNQREHLLSCDGHLAQVG
ncbi:MAG TPA: SIR2 family protein [Thermoanaerobaculia bacterium]|nr:SIR2 family protein [Thermoanaerobaculia bacterium]